MPPESFATNDPTVDTLVCCLSRELPPCEQSTALSFCYSASKIDANSIGWLPKTAYDVRHTNGELLVCLNNEDLVGFVLMSKPSPYQELRCLQIWVRPDARIILHGRHMLGVLENIAAERRCICLRCWCAEDLPSNLFWAAMGWHKKNWRLGPAKKPRRHNLYVKMLSPARLSPFPTEPSKTGGFSPTTLSQPHLLGGAAV